MDSAIHPVESISGAKNANNGPFPSCCLSRFRKESWCSTIVREMSLNCIRIRNSFARQWLCTRTRFETEACSNSGMGYYMHADFNKRHEVSRCSSRQLQHQSWLGIQTIYYVTKCPPNAALEVKINCCIYPKLKITITFTLTLANA